MHNDQLYPAVHMPAAAEVEACHTHHPSQAERCILHPRLHHQSYTAQRVAASDEAAAEAEVVEAERRPIHASRRAVGWGPCFLAACGDASCSTRPDS